MPEKFKVWKKHGHNGYNNHHKNYNNNYGNYEQWNSNGTSQMVSSFGQQNTFIQITNIADIAAIGGFNPNKYLSPVVQPFNFTPVSSPSKNPPPPPPVSVPETKAEPKEAPEAPVAMPAATM